MSDYEVKIPLYRHKVHKDIYIMRNFCCGGNPNTRYYDQTDLYNAANFALRRLEHGDSIAEYEENLERWLDFSGDGPTYVDVTLKKEFEFDGYKGTCKKTIACTTDDFEKVYLVIVPESELDYV